MRWLAAVVLIVVSTLALATLPLKASLEELASQADHIVSGHVVAVEMVDGQGKQVPDRAAMTGPGLKNTIFLVVKVEEVFFSRAKAVPQTIKVPLDPAMHYSFGQIESAHKGPSGSFLLILRGESFEPIVPGVFARPIRDKDQALEIRSKAQSPK